MSDPSAETSPPGTPPGSTVDLLLRQVRHDNEHRRLETERRMEEIHRRLRHVAYLIAEVHLRLVIPKLEDLAARFPNARPPRKEGLRNRIWVDFFPAPAYPSRASLAVESSPTAGAESLRVTVSAGFVPEHSDYEHEACFELRLESPDTKGLGDFLDRRILQFVKDYLRSADPDSTTREDDRVTDPVCKMTLSKGQAASSMVREGRRYYFCVEACRRKFETAPEYYLPGIPEWSGPGPTKRSALRELHPSKA